MRRDLATAESRGQEGEGNVMQSSDAGKHGKADSLTHSVLWLATWLCMLLAMSWGTHAFAHAALVSSTPAQGSALSAVPPHMELVFDEPISPLIFKLIEPDGAAVDLHDVHAITDGVRVALPAASVHGTYALSWRVISADGHPIGGAVIFSVGQAGTSPVLAGHSHFVRDALIWLGLAAWYVALIGGIGLAGCASLSVGMRSWRTLGLSLLAGAAVSTIANMGLLGVDALDLPLRGLIQTQTWWIASTTSSAGLSAILALLAIACAAIVWFAKSAPARNTLALLACLLLGLALASRGHASTAPPVWLARPAVWLHAVAVTLWIGALVPLYHTLKSPAGETVLLRQFSRAIPMVLVVLVLSGAVLIYVQFDDPSSLWRTAYGQVLMVKLVLVAVLLALGASNRYRLTDAATRGNTAARQSLRRAISVEAVIAVVILGVVALWRFTPPPRALDAASVAAVHTVSEHIHGAQALVDLTYQQSPHGGPSSLSLYLATPDFETLLPEAVRVVFFSTAAGIEPIPIEAHHASDGSWQATDIRLPAQDHWDVRIDILVSDFKRIRVTTTLHLPG